MTALDVQKLILPTTPPQWPELPQPVRDALIAGGGTLWHHGACAQRLGPGGSLAYACAAACPVRLAEEALRRRNFLIVNDAVPGYRPICGRCGQKHQYLTQMCVEIPWNGLTEVIAKFKEPTIATNGDAVTECLRLGALVPITAAEALILKTRIRQRGGHIK
jgi:hypothetical protein